MENTHRLAAAIAVVTIAAGAVFFALYPRQYSWLDLAIVDFLAALPLAASLASLTIGKVSLSRSTMVILVFEAMALVMTPAFYLHARCQHDFHEAIELKRQLRYAEAHRLLQQLVRLGFEPSGKKPVARMAQECSQIVRSLESELGQPLAANAGQPEVLDRALKLLALGRVADCIALLDSSAALTSAPAACLMRATIYENLGQWNLARQWYLRAKDSFSSLPESPDRSANLAQSLMGIAFTERKLGHLPAAEAAWKELLALMPTAEMHFRLALFYDDTQQTAKARQHAGQAIDLSPAQFAAPASQLLGKLRTSHFGCMGDLFSLQSAVANEVSESAQPLTK